MTGNRKGFTLLELMIIVGLISLLAVIAVPTFFRSREKSVLVFCQNNLRLIDGAVQQYALEHTNTVAASLAALVGTNGFIKDTPYCKSGGTYTLPSSAADKTTCSIHGTL